MTETLDALASPRRLCPRECGVRRDAGGHDFRPEETGMEKQADTVNDAWRRAFLKDWPRFVDLRLKR